MKTPIFSLIRRGKATKPKSGCGCCLIVKESIVLLLIQLAGMDTSSTPDGQKSKTSITTARNQRLKQIDDLYQIHMRQINLEAKDQTKDSVLLRDKLPASYTSTIKKVTSSNSIRGPEEDRPRPYRSPESESRINKMSSLNVNAGSRAEEDKVRASVFLQGESTRTIEILRRENETKQIKIRELTNKCENLIDRLKGHLSPAELEKEMEGLKEFSDRKMERLENLFKIKNEQIFFKMKLQIIGLLQEFQVSKDEIEGINEVNNESGLYSFMVRKLKIKLKDFRSKEQQSNLQIQKDRILNQKYEERISYLTQTNELLKLSETKLKNKIEDLRSQMNQYLDRIKAKEQEVEEKESDIFRLKKQNEELNSTNQKLSHKEKNIISEKSDERKMFEAKEKEMKALLSSYFLERKKLQAALEEKEGELEESHIREKFLQQENERINREFVRWKERYEWLQKEKEAKQREYEEERTQLVNEFMQYKDENNQGVYLSCKTETDEAIRKVEEYQVAYQRILNELEQERQYRATIMEENREACENMEREWMEKMRRIEKMKEEEMFEQAIDHENRLKELRDEYEKRQELLAEEMQARMKAMAAENDKKTTQRLILLENDNEELRRENQSLQKVIDIKESIIGMLNTKSPKDGREDDN